MPAVGRFMGTNLAGLSAWAGTVRKARRSRMAVRRRPLRYRYRAAPRKRRRSLLNRCR